MEHVMVCVTQQKNCDRLIKEGKAMVADGNGELHIIHIAHNDFKFLGHSKEGEALEYLYQKAMEYGANLTVIRSNNILESLLDLVEKNNISKVVMGESRAVQADTNIAEKFRESIREKAHLILVP